MDETIFDYNVEEIDLKCLQFDHLNKDKYLNIVSQKRKIYDLIVLFVIRDGSGKF